MSDVYFMAVDLGTSYIKVGAYDQTGKCYALRQIAIQSESSRPGVFTQSGEEIYQCVLSCMKQVTETLGETGQRVEAIGFTGQMAGFMGVDKGWNDITSWSCSLDTRYTPYARNQMEKWKEEFLEIGGTNAPLMAPKYEWFVKEYPQKADKIAKYMLISSYIIGKLGKCKIEDATIGRSYITWTGLADVNAGIWSEKLCENVGVSRNILPRIVKYHEICGYLDEKAALYTGLKSGIPLVAGAGDKISGCIGAGVLKKGDLIFETSSYGAVSCLVDAYRPNREKYDYDAIPALEDRSFYIHKYFPGSGVALEWYLRQFCKEYTDKKAAFRKIEEEVKRVACGSDGLVAVGLFGGSAMPFDEEIKGAWVGHTWSHGRGHFYRSLLESYAYELTETLDSIHKMYPELGKDQKIKIIGGGANSTVWPDILSDVTGREFQCLDRDDVALWGAAILAGKGVGYFEDVRTVTEQRIGIQKSYGPNYENYCKYQRYREIYTEMKKTLKPVYKMMKEIL